MPATHLSGFLKWRYVAVALMLVAGGHRVPAQQVGSRETVAEAIRLRDGGRHDQAAALLGPYVAEHPEDVAAARTLAQLQYWLKQTSAARETYEQTLIRHDGDATLRLEYGRMLLEIREDARLREVVTPLLADSALRASAASLLATAAYWRGDLTAAKRQFLVALRADPTLADARRDLRAIDAVTAPWLRVATEYRHDNQPLTRPAGIFEIGWYPTGLTSLALDLRTERTRSGDSLSLGVQHAAVRLTHFSPDAHLDFDGTLGAVQRSASGSDWSGRVALRAHLPNHFTLSAAGERTLYAYTLASISTPVITRVARASLAWTEPRGWLGEATVERQLYPDDNAVSTAFAWVLAPLARGHAGAVQLGYSFAAQNSDHGRWSLAHTQQAYPITDAQFRFDGRYSPYYTPLNLASHSALAAATAHLSPSVTLRLDGAYGVRATDDAPVIVLGGTAAQPALLTTTWQRHFTPWTGRGALDIRSLGNVTLGFSGEVMRTAFYTGSTVRVQATYRLAHASVLPPR